MKTVNIVVPEMTVPAAIVDLLYRFSTINEF